MKTFLSNIIAKAKYFVSNLTPTTKVRYVVISVITVAVTVSLLVAVSLNTSKSEIPTNPEDFETGETQTIYFDTEIIFEIGGESSSVSTTDSINEGTSITTDMASGTDKSTFDEESSIVVTDKNTETSEEPEPQPTDPSEDYNPDPQPEDTSNTPVVNLEPIETTTQTQTTQKPTETTTKAPQPKPTETTKAPQTEPKPTETTQTPQTQPKPTETTTTVPQTTAKPTETTKPQETEPQPVGQFSFKEKKYDYNGANVTILQVENKSQQAYTITITGKFKDANGNIVKTESKTFEGFPAGWSNYFVFQPGVKYSSVTWGLETTEFTSKTFAQGIYMGTNSECSLSQLYADSNGEAYVYPATPDCKLQACVVANLYCKDIRYDGDRTLGLEHHFVVLDADGKIIKITTPTYEGKMYPSEGGTVVNYNVILMGTGYSWEDKDKYVMPESLKNVTVIRSIISVAEE